jgi:hypothetical protein
VDCFKRRPDLVTGMVRQPFHGLSYGRNIFSLGYDKGDEHFPGILPQYPNSGTLSDSFLNESIVCQNALAYLLIIPVQIEIHSPERIPGVGGADDIVFMLAGEGLYIADFVPADESAVIVVQMFYAETLTADGNFSQVKIVSYDNFHGELLFCLYAASVSSARHCI